MPKLKSSQIHCQNPIVRYLYSKQNMEENILLISGYSGYPGPMV